MSYFGIDPGDLPPNEMYNRSSTSTHPSMLTEHGFCICRGPDHIPLKVERRMNSRFTASPVEDIGEVSIFLVRHAAEQTLQALKLGKPGNEFHLMGCKITFETEEL